MQSESVVAEAGGQGEEIPSDAPRDLRRELVLAMKLCTPKMRAYLRKLPSHNFQYWGAARESLGIAKNSVSKWLRDDRFKAVRALQDEIATEDYDLSQRRIIGEYARIAFSDIREAFDDDGKLKRPSEWSDEIAAAMSGIDTQEKRLKENGEWIDEFEIVRKIKMHDKLRALEFLADFKRMSGAKRHELTGPNGEPLQVGPPVIHFVERADTD